MTGESTGPEIAGPEITVLDNGLRVVSHAMPHLGTASLGVWVGVGSRDERPDRHGICHLLEHMAFKGTARRSARDIAEEIEMVGGDLNAATSLEMTAYYVRVLGEDVPLALDILADILTNSVFDTRELALEKDVILQEIAGIADMPDELAYDLVQETAYPNQGLGRPVIGTAESVSKLARDDLADHLRTRYCGPEMVVSAAGAVVHSDIVRHARALFSQFPASQRRAVEQPAFGGGPVASKRSFEQSHVVLGFDSPSLLDEDFYAAQVLSAVLGGGMSSRLFQTAREERGLCYSIYASAWSLNDCGMFNIHAATAKQSVLPLADVIASELEDCAAGGLTERDVLRAKAQIKTGILMSLESSGARAEQMARQLLLRGRIPDPNEIIEKIEAQTPAALQRVAQRLRESGQLATAVVGAGRQSPELAGKVHDRLVS